MRMDTGDCACPYHFEARQDVIRRQHVIGREKAKRNRQITSENTGGRKKKSRKLKKHRKSRKSRKSLNRRKFSKKR